MIIFHTILKYYISQAIFVSNISYSKILWNKIQNRKSIEKYIN